MYVPEHFIDADLTRQIALVRDNNFGTLVSNMDEVPVASHIPFLINDQGTALHGHVARANPQWRSLETGTVLVIFQGPHAYISPTWYETPGVPTWNYTAVHVMGRATLIEEPEALHDIVSRLSSNHETTNPAPWNGEYPDSMLRGIVGFRIDIDRIDGKRKLSQNRPRQDQEGVVRAMTTPFGHQPDDNQRATRSLMKRMLDEN